MFTIAQMSATRTINPHRLLICVGEDAPSRAILCAGAGHFERAHITLTKGRYVGGDADAGERVIALWDEVGDRAEEIVPAHGFVQAERELAGKE